MRGRFTYWFAFDVALALLLAVVGLVKLAVFVPHRLPPLITTLGVYAIVMDWPGTRTSDVDLWVRDPQGNIAWFASQTADGIHLEHDDLGTPATQAVRGRNEERTIVREPSVGEYVVNVDMYRTDGRGATPVTVRLWRLVGGNKLLVERRVMLGGTGDERTVFRFSLDQQGYLTGTNEIPVSLANATVGPPPGPIVPGHVGGF